MSSRIESRALAIVGGPALFLAICLALLAPLKAGAASVVNGDFEIGTLSGWQVENFPSPSPPENNWFAYSGTTTPSSGIPVPAPPQGNFAAITDQGGGGTHVLYQDVALEPYYTHKLSLTAYYNSSAPITIPAPDNLSSTSGANQQYRIDVMKPTADLLSLNPADILAVVFATKAGDPEDLGPTQLTADLSAFAGQTVRLRFAEVDNLLFFNAAVDAISIVSTPPPNAFTLGKAKLNRKKGTAKLGVTVPGAGVISATDARFGVSATARASKAKKRLVKSVTLAAAAAGTVNLAIKPTKAARKILKAKHKLRVKVAVAFTPTGGLTSTQKISLVLRLKPKT